MLLAPVFNTFATILVDPSALFDVPLWLLHLGAHPLGFITALITAASSIAGSLLGGRRGRGALRRNEEQFNEAARRAIEEIGLPVTEQAIGFLKDFVENGGLSEQSQQWLQDMQTQFPEIRQDLLDLSSNFDSLPPEIRNSFQTSLDSISQAADRNQDTLARPGGLTPQQTGAFDRAIQIANGNTDEQNAARDAGLDLVNSRGATEQSGFLFDSAQDARNRVNDPRFDSLLNVAGGNIGNFGFTPQSQELFDQQLGVIQSGGQTEDSQRLIGATQSLIDSGGMTPEIQRALQQVESELQSGGLTPEGRIILDEMTQIVQNRGRGGALLGFDEALTSAGNLAARDSLGQREQLIAAARQRATPGAVVGSGLVGQDTGRLLAQDFAARTAAQDRAALNQQGLQLQQLQGAGATAANIINGSNQRFASLQGSRGDILRAASSNLSSAIQGNVGAQGVETSRLIGAINGANATNNAAVQQFGQSVNLMGNVLDHQLGLLNLSANAAQASGQLQNQNLALGLGTLQGGTGLQLNGAAQAGILATAGAGQQQDAINSLLQGVGLGNQTTGLMLQGRGQNIDMGLGLGNLRLQNSGLLGDFLSGADNRTLSAILGLGNLGQGALNFGLGALQGGQNGAIARNGTSSGIFRNIAGAGLNGLGNLISSGNLNLGGLFGGGSGGSNLSLGSLGSQGSLDFGLGQSLGGFQIPGSGASNFEGNGFRTF